MPEDEGPHVFETKKVERIGDNLFVFYGAARVRRIARINRNMVVIRHNKRELTLVNPVRLCAEGEKKLLELGQVERIIRLSPAHGASHDKYYLQRFPNVRRWSPAASGDIPCHRLLSEDDDAILPHCHIFCFRDVPECALVILQDYVGNLLVTGEALQSQRNNPFVNMPVRTKMGAQGLLQTEIVVPHHWRDKSRKEDFDYLLRLDFERLIGASGVMVHQRAKEETVIAVEYAFPSW